jgi:branched-chain amino acid transport system substrate-binding protein
MDRRRFLAAAGTVALPVVAAAQTPRVVKIVSILPRTGYAVAQTDGIVNAIRLALHEVRSTVAGMRVEYEDRDDATAATGTWTAEREAAVARAAAGDPAVVAVIGPYNSGAAKVSMPILNEAGVVQVSPAATYTGLTKKVAGGADREPEIYRPGRRITFCRVCPTDEVQGGLAARFAATDLKATTAVVLHDGEVYGRGIADEFAAGCRANRVRVLATVAVDQTTNEFAALARTVRGHDPDVIFFGGTTQTRVGAVARALADARVRGPLLVPDGCYEAAFLNAAEAPALNGRCYVTTGVVEAAQLGTRGAAFLRAYRDRFGLDPGEYSVYGYEAAKAVLAGIRTAGSGDREAVRKGVLGTRDFDGGVLPRWGFDAAGDTTLKLTTVSRVTDGRFVAVKTVQ